MLATREELEAYLGTAGTLSARPATGSAGTVPSSLIDLFLKGADGALKSAVPDRTLEREGTTGEPVARTVAVAGQTVRVPDLAELASAAAGGRAIALDRIRLVRRHPSQPAIYVRLRERVFAEELELVGVWGPADSFDETPAPHVKAAVLSWAARGFHNRQSRGADRVTNPAGGVEAFFRTRPPDVQDVVQSLVIPGL